MNILVSCPFHLVRIGKIDEHPSCNCDPEQDVFFCHGCGAKGKLSHYAELVELVERAGERVVAVTSAKLGVPPLAGVPRNYLLSRGFDESMLRLFDVGGDEDKIWFPVKLRSGKYAGFIFRRATGHEYSFSYGFRKSLYLYGTFQFIPDGGRVIVVEGPLDCIKMHQLGYRNTVAFMGSNASSQQLDLIKLLGHTILLALDHDFPGVAAALELGKSLLKRGHTVSFLDYEAADPGDLESSNSFEEFPFLSVLMQVLNSNEGPVKIK